MNQPSLAARLWYRTVQYSCWVVCKILFRLQIAGTNNIPREGPVLLLCNHQSYLDPILVGVASPRRLRFLARKSLFFWPLGAYLRSVGTVPLDRDGTGIGGVKASLRLLREQQAMVIFPEGTRSAAGQLQPLKPGFCSLARKTRAVLVPTAVAGTYEVYPRGRRIPRPGRVALQFGAPIEPDEYLPLSDEQVLECVADRINACYGQAKQNR